MRETTDVRADIEASVDASIAAYAEWSARHDPVGARVAVKRGIACAKALAALEPAPKPAGGEWVTVPRAPTEAMQKAGQVAADNHRWKWCGYGERKEGEGLDGMMFHVREGYRAMLAAAPPAPAASSSGDRCDDCGRTYDTIHRVPNDVWALIAPHPETLGDYPEHYYGGMLCPDCAVDRAKANGIKLVFVAERADAPSAPPSGGEVRKLDPHRFAVVSSDYAHPFLLGAYPKLENAVRAQGGKPDTWHIFERYASPEAPQASEAVRALQLHVAYEALPTDRGGKNGPKGQAWQAFIAARDAALAKIGGDHDE